ncbi:MAG: hypothetical protein AAFR22_26300, partial [Chloroflexota bacterium]
MFKYLLIPFCMLMASCNIQSRANPDILLPEDKPSLVLFCDNIKPECFDTYNLMGDLSTDYDADAIAITFYFVNSVEGERAFTSLELPSYPAYVIFDANGSEISRGVGDFS